VAVEKPANEVAAFLAVFAALLLDNVVRLDETVGEVTDLVMGHGRPSREMVVTLQHFDRLKQEFEALGEALTRYAEAAQTTRMEGDEHAELKRSIISAITVTDLQDRLLRLLQDDTPEVAAPELSPEELEEVGVDVEF
jgi:hypothetical protein